MSFDWARTLDDARAEARRTNRLIFLESGRDNCGNCQKLKRTIIPETSSELGVIAVGYYDDCDRDPFSKTFYLLRDNLPGASTLPLAGFVTADLKWVSGFSGGTDASRFRSEMARARTTYRAMGSITQTRPSLGMAPAAPTPATPSPATPSPAATPLAAKRPLAAMTSLPDAELADVGAELVADAEPESPATTVAAPAAVAVASSPAASPIRATAPAASEVDLRTWARDELARAAAALSARDYAGARAILAPVLEKTRGIPEGREADKGEVAIYNLRKIDRSPTPDATAARERAHKDLRGTVWASLFA